MNRHIISAMSIALGIGATSCGTAGIQHYPEAPQSPDSIDTYFDLKVQDLYRQLENDTSATTLAWVEAERKVTADYLDAIPFRKNIHDRLTELLNYTKTGMPWKGRDGYYYFYENDGLRNQAVLYRTKHLGDSAEVYLDPNTLSKDGTVALKGVYPDNNNRYTAYTVSRNGSDWEEIYVMDTATGKLLSDHIEWAKFTTAAWQGDGFYYSAYARPDSGKEFSNENTNHRIYYHKIGTSQSEDKLAYEDEDHPYYFHNVWIPESENVIVLYIEGNGVGNAMKIKDLRNAGSKWITVEPTQDKSVSVVDVIGDSIIFMTSHDAPNSRLAIASIAKPERTNWKELVANDPNGVLIGAQSAGDKLILTYQRDAAHHAAVYDRSGVKLRDIELPSFGQVGFSSDKDNDEVFYSFTSFLSPSAIYRYDINTGKSELYRATEIKGFDMNDYETEQVFFASTDGTKIPMFITHKKGLERNGKNPVYLYGYGGFNVSLNPAFSAQRLLWLENGGIYVSVNLRGGGEYGESWHEAGTKMNKLNVFNDFISAAETLIKEGWTSSEHLVIEGGSNGGLLIGACVNMRPDLFAVAIPRVGVMDMMRYHLFTIGWNWAPDYGTSADSKEMAHYLYDYSPIHNISNDGTPYPAIMVTTADHDDRVVPAHSFKYAAALQAANTGSKPKIIRIDSNAGHGGGKPVSKVIDEYTDIYSFIYYNLGIKPNTAK